MNKKRIWLSPPHMSSNEKKLLNKAFESNWIAPLGPFVDKFENEISNYLNIHNALALSSGTSALHLAMILLGVKRGDEVICSSFTFAASANPIVYLGATPVFLDSELETWNMSPRYLEIAIKERIQKGKKPKAILLVHLYGMPAKLKEIIEISNHYKIPVIEDAAEALGSCYKNKKLGTFGEMGVLSFNGNKIITTSGGGALVSWKKEYIEKARFLSTQARDPAPHYQHSHIGYNYRLSNLLAAVGVGQMKVIEKRVKKRRENFLYYKKNLNSIPWLEFLEEPKDLYSNRWLTTVLLNSKAPTTTDIFRKTLEKGNIESRPLWKPMHLQPIFKKYPYYGETNSEDLFKTGVCLPSGSDLTKADFAKIFKIIKSLV